MSPKSDMICDIILLLEINELPDSRKETYSVYVILYKEIKNAFITAVCRFKERWDLTLLHNY
jgi:hypothetical protein